MDLILRHARVRGRDKPVDIAVNNGVIARLAPKISGRARASIDCAGRLVSPPFTDIHVHLDAVLTVGQPRFNQSGTLIEGIEIWAERKKSLTFDDVKRRATLAVKWELAHGVTRIRSHVDVCDPELTAVQALLEVKREFAGLVDIQLVAFPQDGIYAFPNGESLMERAMELGCDLVGGIPHHEMTRDDGVADVKFACDLAQQFHTPLDLHIDETDDPNSRFTEVLAAETIKRGLNGRVTASHTTSMHSVDNAYAFKLIRLIKRAGLHMVTNPCDNSVLQGRFDTYPKRRGHTRVKELLAAGVNVAIGHDSIMDPWYPLGVGDPLQAAFVWIHYGQMSGMSEIPQVWDMITANPAKAFGATDKSYGIAVGNPADLVLLDAETEFDALRRIAPRLLVMRAGQIIARTTPAETVICAKGWKKEVISFNPTQAADT
ncbi:MAG TPA: cytosine deaminase [Verrucomicrobiae bacterium]|nr:cytosine deaminase [Verrucomicrobiae bacterium]